MQMQSRCRAGREYPRLNRIPGNKVDTVEMLCQFQQVLEIRPGPNAAATVGSLTFGAEATVE